MAIRPPVPAGHSGMFGRHQTTLQLAFFPTNPLVPQIETAVSPHHRSPPRARGGGGVRTAPCGVADARDAHRGVPPPAAPLLHHPGRPRLPLADRGDRLTPLPPVPAPDPLPSNHLVIYRRPWEGGAVIDFFRVADCSLA